MSVIVKVALLQLAACGVDQASNLSKGEAFCRQARLMGADIALFPEMWKRKNEKSQKIANILFEFIVAFNRFHAGV